MRVSSTLRPLRRLLDPATDASAMLAPLQVLLHLPRPTEHDRDEEGPALGGGGGGGGGIGAHALGGEMERDPEQPNKDSSDKDIYKLFARLGGYVTRSIWDQGLAACQAGVDGDMEAWVAASRDICLRFDSFNDALSDGGHVTDIDAEVSALRVSVLKFVTYALSAGFPTEAVRRCSLSLLSSDPADTHYGETGDTEHGTIGGLFRCLVSTLPSLAESIHGADQSSAVCTVTEELVRWFEGRSFEYAHNPNVEFILSGLGGDCDGAQGSGATAFRSLPLLVQIRWLVQLLTCHDQRVLSRLIDELRRRGISVKPFIPSKIQRAVAHVRSSRGRPGHAARDAAAVDIGVEVDAPISIELTDTSLAALLYEAYSEVFKHSQAYSNVVDMLQQFARTRQMCHGDNPLHSLNASAIAVHTIEVAAAQWSQRGAIIEPLSEQLLELFDFADGLQEYFLVCLRLESSMTQFLSDRDRLLRFRLDDDWGTCSQQLTHRGSQLRSTEWKFLVECLS